MGREFILADKQLKFDQDRFFNPYNPEASEAVWKSAVKKIFGLTPKKDETSIIENNVIGNYHTFVNVEITHLVQFQYQLPIKIESS